MGFDAVFESFPVLCTDRLVLREIGEDDYNELHQVFADPEVMQYFGIEPQQTMEEARTLVKRFRQGYEAGRAIRWGITLKCEDKIIGTCGFHNLVKRDSKTEIGYDLMRAYWGKGIMTDATRALLEFAFDKVELNRIEALVEPPNAASVRLVEKLGFQREGLMREHAFYGGQVRDCYIYSLLKRVYVRCE